MARGFVIKKIFPGSLADKAGLRAGDRLFKINGSCFYDLLDYHYLCSEQEISLTLDKGNGSTWQLSLQKRYEEDLGLEFASPLIGPLRRCQNNCVFCFVDQQPPGLRPSLYTKDDDYRLSFLHGNYLTLTNMGSLDLKRVIRRRLSPLYISIHATDPRVRRMMMGHAAAGNILKQLKKMAEAGLEMHGQIVICPGYNDGAVLEKTVADLVPLYPYLKTLALVPVGLTRYRQNLKKLRSVSPREAAALVERYSKLQKQFQETLGSPFLYLADELYLLSALPLPPHEHYGAYQQLENGVGLGRLFLNELEKWKKKDIRRLKKETALSLATGQAGERFLTLFLAELQKIKNLKASLHVVENSFWGGNVAVTGLLTGQDLLAGLQGKKLGDFLFIPSHMFKEGTELFLDGTYLQELAGRLKVKIRAVPDLMGIKEFWEEQGLLEARQPLEREVS